MITTKPMHGRIRDYGNLFTSIGVNVLEGVKFHLGLHNSICSGQKDR